MDELHILKASGIRCHIAYENTVNIKDYRLEETISN